MPETAQAGAGAHLAVLKGHGRGERLRITSDLMVMGRSRRADVVIPDRLVSQLHAEIARKQDTYELRDLGSRNGTLYNGLKLETPVQLRDGDVIEIGHTRLAFRTQERDGDFEPEPTQQLRKGSAPGPNFGTLDASGVHSFERALLRAGSLSELVEAIATRFAEMLGARDVLVALALSEGLKVALDARVRGGELTPGPAKGIDMKRLDQALGSTLVQRTAGPKGPVLYMPLRAEEGSVLAVVALHPVDLDCPSAEPGRLRLLCGLAAVHLRNSLLLSQLRERNSSLEEARRELEERSRRLETARARHAAVVNASLDGVLSFDEEGRIQDVNPAAREIFRLEEGEEPIGSHLKHLIVVTEDSVPKAVAAGSLPLDERCRVAGRRLDGSRFPAELVITQLGPSGPPAFVAYVRDVTEETRIALMKDEFVATVSHELRTPLTAILGSLGLVEGGMVGALPREATELLSVAKANANRLVRLVSDFLDLEKIQANKFSLRRTHLCLRELADGVVADLAPLASQEQVTIGISSDLAEAPQISGDRDRLVQVLTNLVSNGIKFSPPGAAIAVRLTRGRQLPWRVEVSDRGPGIPAEEQQAIFERFARGASSSMAGGTGLGLTIAKALVDQHGGQLGLESTPGAGSTFFFELP